jgi:hypothetical protein
LVLTLVVLSGAYQAARVDVLKCQNTNNHVKSWINIFFKIKLKKTTSFFTALLDILGLSIGLQD